MLEKFKKFNEIMEVDERNTFFKLQDRETGEISDFTLKHIYDEVEYIQLDNTVDDDIVSQFNVAKNIAVYTWFSYSFNQIAELKAYSVVEMAIRKLYNDNKTSFKKLIIKAIKEERLKDENFLHLQKIKYEGSFVKNLPMIITEFRNSLAHGSTMLDNKSILTLHLCKDIINQIYSSKIN